MQRVTYFFATVTDIAFALRQAEEKHNFVYLALPDIKSPNLQRFANCADIPGFMTTEKGGRSRQFYLVPPEVSVFEAVQEAVLASKQETALGWTRYDLHPKDFESVVVFDEYGMYQADSIVVSRYYLVGDGAAQKSLYRFLNRALKKTFTRVRGHFVGPEAYEFLVAGKRLTAFVTAPAANDLKLEDGCADRQVSN